MYVCSVEENQERLWKRSIEVLKDHLSPTILEKYGPTTIPIPDPISQNETAPSENEPSPSNATMETADPKEEERADPKEEVPEEKEIDTDEREQQSPSEGPVPLES